MNDKIESLAKVILEHGKFTEKRFNITDKRNYIHNFVFSDKFIDSIRLSSARSENIYEHYFDCEMPSLNIKARFLYHDGYFKSDSYYNFNSNYEEDLLQEVFQLAVEHINKKELVIPNDVTMITEKEFTNYNLLETVIISESVTSIGNEAFSWCKALKTVSLSEGLKRIGRSAFSGCESLTTITIPDSVEYIGDGAFYRCKSLKSVIISDGLTSIGRSSFEDCKSLSNILIPNSVKEIGVYAFWGCESLSEETKQLISQINKKSI